MKTWIFLQVRLGSQRLPNKALLLLSGKPVILHAMESLNGVGADGKVLLTDDQSSKALLPLAEAAGWSLFAGDPDNVLDRFIQASKQYSPDIIIRATGDNPLVSGPLAKITWDLLKQNKADYSAHEGMPLGTGVEVVKTQALWKAWESHPDAYEREHVTPYIYRHPGEFRLLKELAPPEYRGTGRLTLDTPEDYLVLEHIFREKYRGSPLTVKEALSCLEI